MHEEAVSRIANQFANGFPLPASRPRTRRAGSLSASSPLRTVGREAEYPVVRHDGRAVDLAQIWPLLSSGGNLTPKLDARWSRTPSRRDNSLIAGLTGDDYSYALEVGRGTIEINTRPCTDLHELLAIHRQAVARLVRAAGELGWYVLGYGIQPISPPSPEILSPKQRYVALLDAMGPDWLWYAITASDQTHVSIHRHEMLLQLNTANLMAPAIVAMCANSPVFTGKLSPYCSSREGVTQEGPYAGRHGMPQQPYPDLETFVSHLAQKRFLLRRKGEQLVPNDNTFAEFYSGQNPDFDAFLLHEHYIWHSARLRHAYGTVEIRPACQQPWNETMAATAFCLGIVEAAPAIWAYVEDTLGPNFWKQMRSYHTQAVRQGLLAAEPAADLLSRLVELASQGLETRGQGEEIYLTPLKQRLAAREAPAQKLRRRFTEEGLQALLAETRIKLEN